FSKELYRNEIPDTPGGGTVKWTNRWGGYSYISDIEVKEDGGTPGFLQGIKAALAVRLKEKMGTQNMRKREQELLEIAFSGLSEIKSLHLLAGNITDRLGVISFYIDNIHHNLVTRLLNDRYGIQVRGGCSCAGTYGHFLLDVDFGMSKEITDRIDAGDLSMKPGWIRLSLHPTMTNDELQEILKAITEIAENASEWAKDYVYDRHTNEFLFPGSEDQTLDLQNTWFEIA
ncbi:MAG TPA: aminotransferase class V-fold PLP-dependent enzyme, partial [Bacteroidales bacterium]|nr:aminotransferase class V-fold PLP-dependent enzyme [Bacteroidales bacterium]